MSIESVTLRGRVAREALMRDTCQITEPSSEPAVFNEATGQYDAPPRVVVYEGKCRVQVKADINSNVVEATSGDREWTYQTSTLELPVVGTERIRTDHVARVLTSELDSALVGTEYQLLGNYQKSQSVCRRFRVKEVSA